MTPRLTVRPWALPLLRPLVTARATRTTRRGWQVELRAGNLTGQGEAVCWPGFGAGVRATRRALRAAAADPRGLARLTAAAQAGDEAGIEAALAGITAPEARAALEAAALDLAAQEAGRSLAGWLWPHPRGEVPIHTLVRDAGEARSAVAAGAGALKLKVGFEPAARERERLAAVRAAVGPGPRLRLDANGAWSTDEALARLRRLSPLGIDLVEQPVPPGDLAGLARVRAAGVPLAVDEGLRHAGDLEALLASRACQAIVLKPSALGGLLPARRLAARAEAAGLRVVVTHALESAVGRAAALALAAGLADPHEAHGLGPALREATGGVAARGVVRVPRGPGLGVRVDTGGAAESDDAGLVPGAVEGGAS